MRLRRPAALAALAVLAQLLSGCAEQPGSSLEPTTSLQAPSAEAAAPVPVPEPQPSEPAVSDAPAPPINVPIRKADAALEAEDARPISLNIEGTDIAVAVVEVGIEENGAMEIPDSFWEAGWYRFGPAPGGERGNAVIAAHVDSLTEVMPFAQLKDAELGSIVTVQLADGRSVAYEVTDVSNVPKATLDGSAIFARDGPHQLKVITCGGEWLPEIGDYEDNIVLTASPL